MLIFLWVIYRTIILFTLPDDKKPFLWKIFMDEVFLIWTHGLKSLGIYKTFKLLSFGC